MIENKEIKMLSPKVDIVFQALFGEVGSEKITKGFLESILKEKINKIDLSKNPILKREFEDDKLGVLDILAELNGKENCNIEMQIVNKEDIIERMLYYWSRLFSRQIKKGKEYITLERTIVILIADFKIEKLKELEYHSKWKIIEENERNVILTNKLEIHIIELPKIEGKEKEKDKLLDWLYFLENPKLERVEEEMKENEELKEAKEKLQGLSEDEKMQRIADLREKAIRDEASAHMTGFNQGIKKGIEKGIEKGIKQKQEETVKKMLEEKISIEIISKVTGMSEDEIKRMK